VHRAGARLGEDRGVAVQPLDGEHQPVGHGDVLGEETRVVAAQTLEVGAEDEPAGPAVVAVAAVHVGVDGDLLADAEAGHALAQPVDHTDQFVAGDEREHRVEVTVVDVQVRSAHTDLVDLDAHLAGTGRRGRDVGYRVGARGVVDDSLHGVLAFSDAVGLSDRRCGPRTDSALSDGEHDRAPLTAVRDGGDPYPV
jgi:hypothetical protein